MAGWLTTSARRSTTGTRSCSTRSRSARPIKPQKLSGVSSVQYNPAQKFRSSRAWPSSVNSNNSCSRAKMPKRGSPPTLRSAHPVLKVARAERRLLRTLTQPLTLEQRTRLDGLLHADTSIRGATRLSWLRQAPGVTSPKILTREVPSQACERFQIRPTQSWDVHFSSSYQLSY